MRQEKQQQKILKNLVYTLNKKNSLIWILISCSWLSWSQRKKKFSPPVSPRGARATGDQHHIMSLHFSQLSLKLGKLFFYVKFISLTKINRKKNSYTLSPFCFLCACTFEARDESNYRFFLFFLICTRYFIFFYTCISVSIRVISNII